MTAPALNWEAVHTGTEVTVWVDGLRFDLTTTTAELCAALSTGNTGPIVPGGFPVEQQLVWIERLFDLDGDFDLVDSRAIAEAVIEHLTGVPLSTAVAICQWLTSEWLLLRGWFRGRGVDLMALSPRDLMAVLYAFLVEHRYEDREQADRALFPPRAKPPTAADLAQDAANFQAALAMAGSLPGVD